MSLIVPVVTHDDREIRVLGHLPFCVREAWAHLLYLHSQQVMAQELRWRRN